MFRIDPDTYFGHLNTWDNNVIELDKCPRCGKYKREGVACCNLLENKYHDKQTDAVGTSDKPK